MLPLQTPTSFIKLLHSGVCRSRVADMKTIWSAETASKVYIETVQTLNPSGFQLSAQVAEFMSAMAAGYNAQLIVEAWAPGAGVATSVGLAVATRHTGGRHVCLVPDERSRLEYVDATSEAGVSPEFVVGEAKEAMEALQGVDFMVVDGRRRDLGRVLRYAKISSGGAVLMCTHPSGQAWSDFRWRELVGGGTRVSRSSFLPAGKGVEIVRVGKDRSVSARGRWINREDRTTGEEYFLRR